MPVAITAEQCAETRASPGLRSSDSAYATVPSASASNRECPLEDPSPCRTASGIFPTARPSAASDTIGRNPSASTNSPSTTISAGLVSHNSRSTRSRGDLATRAAALLPVMARTMISS